MEKNKISQNIMFQSSMDLLDTLEDMIIKLNFCNYYLCFKALTAATDVFLSTDTFLMIYYHNKYRNMKVLFHITHRGCTGSRRQTRGK